VDGDVALGVHDAVMEGVDLGDRVEMSATGARRPERPSSVGARRQRRRVSEDGRREKGSIVPVVSLVLHVDEDNAFVRVARPASDPRQ